MVVESIKRYYLKFIIFCFVGASSALVYMLFFNIFRFWLKFSFILALFFGVLFSIVYNFSMNRNITFSAKHQSIKKQLIKYVLVYAISTGVNITSAWIMNLILGGGVLRENIAAIAGIILSIPFSFLGSLLWVFKKQTMKDPSLKL
ncbi:MAG: GtrA family protein [Nanoarchaeota archaeon]|nr:GtrA family protein [Nanoarchaeota archaeon]